MNLSQKLKLVKNMSSKISEKIGEILIKLGTKLKNDPDFIEDLEALLDGVNSENADTDPSNGVPRQEKIDELDLYELAKSKTDEELEKVLTEFSVKELKIILKKYHFGVSSKQRTAKLIIPHIINHLRKRTTDVFKDS